MVYFMLRASTPITKKFKLQENITSLAYIKINQKNSIKKSYPHIFLGYIKIILKYYLFYIDLRHREKPREEGLVRG